MYCPVCGAYVEDGQPVCDACGAPLANEVEVGVAEAPTPHDHDAEEVAQPVDEAAVKEALTTQGAVGFTPLSHAAAPISPLPVRTSRQSSARRTDANLPMVAGIALGAAAVLITAMLVFGRPFGSSLGNEPVPVPDPVEEEQEAEPVEETVEEPEPAESETPVRESFIAYSWDELSRIAAEIEQCPTRAAALEVARNYNLVDMTGSLPMESKEVDLSDGRPLYVRLVDIYHDDASTPSGKAGLTFVASNCLFEGAMSYGITTDGGWESSIMRSWLDETMWGMLPAELQTAIIPVTKMSNNVGESLSTDCVTATTDKLWLLSIVELVGPVNWDFYSDPSNSGIYNAVFNAEGSQYLLYQQMGVSDWYATEALAISDTGWWYRSTAASTGRARCVDASGDPTSYGDSNEERGVVPGFCL